MSKRIWLWHLKIFRPIQNIKEKTHNNIPPFGLEIPDRKPVNKQFAREYPEEGRYSRQAVFNYRSLPSLNEIGSSKR
jgi:hypothetical protein